MLIKSKRLLFLAFVLLGIFIYTLLRDYSYLNARVIYRADNAFPFWIDSAVFFLLSAYMFDEALSGGKLLNKLKQLYSKF